MEDISFGAAPLDVEFLGMSASDLWGPVPEIHKETKTRVSRIHTRTPSIVIGSGKAEF